MTARPTVLALALLAGVAGRVQADPPPHHQIGFRYGYDRFLHDPYLGAELLWPLSKNWFLVGDVQYVHRPQSQHFTISADVHYAITLKGRLYGWAGAGIGLISEDPDGPVESDTNDGVGNLILGVGFDGPAIPYFQIKWSGHKGGRVSFGVGVRF
jgi:hypothetical protein